MVAQLDGQLESHALDKKVILILSDGAGDATDLITSILESNDFRVHRVDAVTEALAALAMSPADLVICGAAAGATTSAFMKTLRSNANTAALPVLALRDMAPVRPPELIARVRQLLAPPQPARARAQDRRSPERLALAGSTGSERRTRGTGQRLLPNESAFDVECAHQFEREGERRKISIAYVELVELAHIRATHGEHAQSTIATEFAAITQMFPPILRIAACDSGRFTVLVRGTHAAVRQTLTDLAQAVAAHRFHLASEPVRLTPLIGYATRMAGLTAPDLREQALAALGSAEAHHDLRPVRYHKQLDHQPPAHTLLTNVRRLGLLMRPLVLPLQIAATFAGCLVVPFFVYWFLAAQHLDITGFVYVVCVIVLVLTSAGIIWESALALRNDDPPPARLYPTASAIIAAYLPNEAGTVVESVESFLRMDYAGDMQIILAYNTPHDLPMELELRAIAERDPRFVLMRVAGSTSKAQNVNAALQRVRGAFVGVFDADHKPDPNSFTRAWDWLAAGYDIVQGHCVIRNGDESLVSQIVAVEFESIYAVSHPGRARLHGFGLFGGSNGYWKTELLRQTRMHHFMLTEDIDSSLRVIEAGYRIKSDPKLISRELAPIDVRAFWNQRLRWAQGWFQVSIKHVIPALRSPHLSVRQKAGMMHLLIWREGYVWMSVQILPILAFWTLIRHDHVSWWIPIFLVSTVFTALTGPIQLLFTYFLADPEIRMRRRWFFTNFIFSLLIFSEFKNAITRLAHLKEAVQERTWKVTPRAAAAEPLA